MRSRMEKEIYQELMEVRGPGEDLGVKLFERYDPQYLAGLKAFYADGVLGRSGGSVSRATKEMVIMVCAATQRSWSGMTRHMAKALDYGAKPREVLEFLEAASINAGIPVIWRGSTALAEELPKRGLPFDCETEDTSPGVRHTSQNLPVPL